MRKSALAGFFVLCAVLAAHNRSASALTENGTNQIKLGTAVVTSLQGMPFMGTTPIEEMVKLEEESHEPKRELPPEPKQHTVEDGETLETIAAKNDTSWIRLFNKNVELADPDDIKPGQKLVIPLPGEQLAERPLPEAAEEESPPPPPVSTTKITPRRTQRLSPRPSAGNTYARGYCTWYAKSRRPDLPNHLGNADTWVSRAAAMGLATGSTPKAGAIGQQGMHVVYVERVNGDGTVTVSEMNYKGWGVVSSRTVPASTFRYIY